MHQKELNPCFISSYTPRKCGIATFTHNLFTSYQNLYATAGKIVAVDELLDVEYPPEVDLVFNKNKVSDYLRAAEHINSSNTQVVNLQHEFGLFGGPEGQHIIKLLEKSEKPIVTTIHTVLKSPSLGYYTSLVEVMHRSQRVVVMSNKAIEILREVYYVPMEKIAMIPHGVPDLPCMGTESFKKDMGFTGRFVLLTFGLLSPGKGIEVALEALPEVVKNNPEVLYIILGKTHPEIVRIHGERYRENLYNIVRKYSLDKNVMFIDKFVTNEDLYNFINCSDIYITPYLSPEQITSGTLAYAVALGKAVVSTPYWYAQELLADGRGCLVPFSDPKVLAGTLNKLLSNRDELPKMRRAAYQYGRSMVWSKVSEQYRSLFREVYKEHYLNKIYKISTTHKNSFVSLDQRKILDMFERLTDETGIFQHAKYGIPDLRHGYSADDVGRALGVIMRAAQFENEPQYFNLAKKYLSFLLYVQKEDGLFHNFVGYDRRILDEVGSDDTFGRVLLGLGGAVAWTQNPSIAALAREIFDRAIADRQQDLPLSPHPKATAYSICGLYDYLKKFPEASKVRELIRAGADYLIKLNQANRTDKWDWFDPAVTYANAKIPYALMLAYNVFKEKSYLDTALATLKFLTDLQYNGTYFDIVGNQNWLVSGAKRARFDQQPIEIGYLVEAYCEALRRTKNKDYLELADRAFSWFFGNNCLGVPVYNIKYDYPLDGLTASGANDNSGAESVISFALAVTSLKEISVRKTLGRKLRVK